uniref:MADF domain-containing protein n=1 Tax=Ditylenchus dipsaci TaxID=166011 RepID=A0A915CTE4_9BILA
MFKQNLFSDGKEAMSVWKNLRSSYKKKKDKKLPSGSASEPEKQKWVHYAEMNFLKNHIEDRIAQSSTLVQCSELVIDEEGENQCKDNCEVEFCSFYVFFSFQRRPSVSLSPGVYRNPVPLCGKKKRVMDEFESKMLELVEKEEICTLARDVDEKMKKISGARHARIKMAFERAVREQIYQVDEYLLDNQILRSKLALLVLLRRRKRQKKGRRYWVHPLWRNRPELGAYFALLPQLKVNPDKFFDYMRMNPEVFATLLRVLNERLTKYSIRTPICAEERLMLTIRYLATGESYRSLSFQFRMGCMTVCRIISDTCSAIYEVLHQYYLAMPKTAEEWHQDVCKPEACNQMTATEQWIFLCAAHRNPKECSAIDYTRHTLDGAACLLNSNRYFSSRISIKESSIAKIGSVCRRVYRIFSHAYFHHRTVFDAFENESFLCKRFTTFVIKYQLMAQEHLIVPILQQQENTTTA